MNAPSSSRRLVRFGLFEADLSSRELRKNGARIRLQDQPFQVLSVLLDRPGGVVTRDELRQKIWPGDTFIDFDKGLNVAINKIREALGDSAENPRFVETLPRRGYRFLASLNDAQSNSVTGRSPIDSIAVLPLANSSPDLDTECIAVGIPGNIIHRLSQIPGLRVVSWNSVSCHKDQDTDPQTLGRRFNVRALLVGRIWVRANKLRLHVDLVDTASGEELWGEQYDRDLTEIFTIQDEIAREVSQKLELKLTGAQSARLGRHYTDNIEAYQLYVRGRHSIEKRSMGGFKKGSECLNEAIQKDPGYALAYAELSQCLHMPAYYGVVSPQEAYPRAKSVALKALAIDDTLAEAHDTLATVMQNFDWDWDSAGKEYKRAIELNPNYPVARLHYAMHLSLLGRFEESIREATEGQRRDPMSGVTNAALAFVLVNAGRFDRCIEQSLTTIDIDPALTFTYVSLAMAYERKGMFPEAIMTNEKSLELGGSAAFHKSALGHAYASSGDHARARDILRELQQSSERGYMPFWSLAIVYDGLGEKELAIELLQKALERREAMLVSLRVWPLLEKSRDDPRFQEIERRVGLRSRLA
jgi:TolB-like protein/Flp pilus assembly protein TadD